MVGVIVRLGFALNRRRMTAGKAANLALGATIGSLLAVGTMTIAFLDLPHHTRIELLAVVLGAWLLGWLVAPSFTGGPDLTGQHFRMHPISRRVLVSGLFAAALTGMPAIVAAVAFCALIAVAVPLGIGATLVAIPATVLSVAVLIMAARLAGIGFAAVSKSRLGAAISATVTAVIIVVAQHSWILIVAIAIHLETGLPSTMATVIRAIPTSWGLIAVESAGAGDWLPAVGALMALTLLAAVLYAAWTKLVTAPLIAVSAARAPRRIRSSRSGPVSKELRAWIRDPLRLQNIVLATTYAIGTCALPLLLDFGGFLPFLGVAMVLMGAGTGSNLFGGDGTALWLTLATPGTEAREVRGRQLAWVTVFGGIGAILTAVGIALYPDPVLLPWVLATFIAVVGIGAGLVVFVSLRMLVPSRDPHLVKHSPADHGNQTGPAFMMMALVVLLAMPTVGVLILGQTTGNMFITWAGAAAGIGTALLITAIGGRLAARYLAAKGPELLQRMRSGSSPKSSTDTGTPDGIDQKISGLEAMRPGQSLSFWLLFVIGIIATVPQGLVSGGHILAGTDITGWFVALHMPTHLQWPTVGAFIMFGLAAAGGALLILLQARRSAREIADGNRVDGVLSAGARGPGLWQRKRSSYGCRLCFRAREEISPPTRRRRRAMPLPSSLPHKARLFRGAGRFTPWQGGGGTGLVLPTTPPGCE
ncbi:ABC-2 type transport system permease protein [Stackebrandtia endophytica]|uniref:ABC-2 type transport system permease protein n=1 Tax=Stackebrandtia endophytica TaxID=1496996 RepID=A0A543B091_9ACTN|nr:hypothetical protein [Stackebrandtia endophytica]TQL78255.1 ABC-2 type transport system permease protein [Stackebrandtia endophytica]